MFRSYVWKPSESFPYVCLFEGNTTKSNYKIVIKMPEESQQLNLESISYVPNRFLDDNIV